MHAALFPILNAGALRGFSIVNFTAPCYFVASAGCLLLLLLLSGFGFGFWVVDFDFGFWIWRPTYDSTTYLLILMNNPETYS